METGNKRGDPVIFLFVIMQLRRRPLLLLFLLSSSGSILLPFVGAFSILNLDGVDFVLRPPDSFCGGSSSEGGGGGGDVGGVAVPPKILAIVHSAPKQWQLRDAIRYISLRVTKTTTN